VINLFISFHDELTVKMFIYIITIRPYFLQQELEILITSV